MGGWKPEYGISEEGEALLGYVEALPDDARVELLALVDVWFRRNGYVSLHDEVRASRAPAEGAKVIPFRKAR